MTQKTPKPLFDPAEIEEISLVVLSRVKELTSGEHGSTFTSAFGTDFSSIKEIEPGDPIKKIDWGRSTMTGFNPLMVRDCVEERSIDIIMVADSSLSVRCGMDDITVSHVIARAIATLGFSAVILQDLVGLISFGTGDSSLVEPPRGGRNQIFRIIEVYENSLAQPANKISDENEKIAETVSANLRRTSLIMVISDFMFPEAKIFIKDLTDLKSSNDLFLVMADSAFAFNLPAVSSGWIEGIDAETGRRKLLSRKEYTLMASRARNYQNEIKDFAEKEGIEVLRVGADANQFQNAMVDFFFERRLNKK